MLDDTSPDTEVPDVVSELKPHRWHLRPGKVAHISVMKWEPYGTRLPPQTAPKTSTRNLRSRQDQNGSHHQKDELVYQTLLKASLN